MLGFWGWESIIPGHEDKKRRMGHREYKFLKLDSSSIVVSSISFFKPVSFLSLSYF